MARSRKALRPAIEAMESRLQPSGSVHAMPAALVVSTQVVAIRPGGTVHGRFTQSAGMADAGTSVTLKGQGRLRGLGAVEVSGSVQGLGFVNVSRAEGYVTLTNSRGGITLHLFGPMQHGLAPLPENFRYVIEGGTGVYTGATGQGRVDLLLPNTPVESTAQGLQKSGPFTLQVHPLAALV